MSTPSTNGAVAKSGVHPGLVVGAIAVVVFGAAGAASYLGLLPGQAAREPAAAASLAQPAPQAAVVPDAVVPPPAAAAPAPVEAAPAPQPAAAQPAPARPPVARPAPKPAPASRSPQPAPAASAPGPSTPSYASNAPAYSPAPPSASVAAPPPAAAPSVCRNCGTVSEIIPIQRKGESSGAGALLGGIVGGVLGHQVGGGRGKDVATVAGALGGALVGNEIEKDKSRVTAWNVRVRLEDGTNKVVRYGARPAWRVGDRVRIENGRIVGD